MRRYEAIVAEEGDLESLDFQTTMNLLKVNSSELAIAIVSSSLQACGLAGYRNDGEFSVTRHLRDALSSAALISKHPVPGELGQWRGVVAGAAPVPAPQPFHL